MEPFKRFDVMRAPNWASDARSVREVLETAADRGYTAIVRPVTVDLFGPGSGGIWLGIQDETVAVKSEGEIGYPKWIEDRLREYMEKNKEAFQVLCALLLEDRAHITGRFSDSRVTFLEYVLPEGSIPADAVEAVLRTVGVPTPNVVRTVMAMAENDYLTELAQALQDVLDSPGHLAYVTFYAEPHNKFMDFAIFSPTETGDDRVVPDPAK